MKGWQIVVLVFLLYGMSVFGGFIQDDRVVILGNKSLGSVSSLFTSLGSPYYNNDPVAGAYRPVTSFSLSLNALLLGSNAWGYRLVNVVLYAYLCWLVFVLVKSLSKGSGLFWIVPAVFAVHPIHSEAVNNIVGRSEILALIFVILMILSAMKRKWETSILFYLLAVFSKESVVSSIVFLLYFIWKEKRSIIGEKIGVVIYAVSAVMGYFAIRFMVLGGYLFSNNATRVENPLRFVDTIHRVMGALSTLTLGVEKLIWPMRLSYDYSFNQIPVPNFVDFGVAIGIVVIIVSFVVWIKYRGQVMVDLGMMFFWLPILVTGNFVFATGTIFGERLWMTPSLGFVILVFWLLRPYEKWIKGNIWLVITIIVLLSARTMIRSVDWLSEKNLFLHDVTIANKSVMTQSNAAAVWLSERRFDKAKVSLELGDSIDSSYPMLMNNWGIYYWWQGDKTEARNKFQLCLEKHSDFDLCKFNLKILNDN